MHKDDSKKTKGSTEDKKKSTMPSIPISKEQEESLVSVVNLDKSWNIFI